MTDTKILIDMAFAGEVPEEYVLEQLGKRSEEQIIQDLKENVSLDGLLQTQDALENYLDSTGINEDNRKCIEQTKKALERTYKAINQRCSELIGCEKKLKELMFN